MIDYYFYLYLKESFCFVIFAVPLGIDVLVVAVELSREGGGLLVAWR